MKVDYKMLICTTHTVILEAKMSLTELQYSSVPNRRIGPNKRAGGKILKKH